MSRLVSIVFRDAPSIHKVRNFAEELSLSIEREDLGLLPMDEADTAIDRVLVTTVHARKLRRAVELINKLLRKHYLQDSAVVTPVDVDQSA